MSQLSGTSGVLNIALWVNPYSLATANMPLFSFGIGTTSASCGATLDPNNAIVLESTSSTTASVLETFSGTAASYSASSGWAPNTWAHVVVATSANTFDNLYLNGALAGSTVPTQLLTGNRVFYSAFVGATQSTAGANFYGLVASVQIYGTSLSAGQIAYMASGTSPGPPPSPPPPPPRPPPSPPPPNPSPPPSPPSPPPSPLPPPSPPLPPWPPTASAVSLLNGAIAWYDMSTFNPSWRTWTSKANPSNQVRCC